MIDGLGQGPLLRMVLESKLVDRGLDAPVELDADHRMDGKTFAEILRYFAAATERFIAQNDPVA